MTILKPAILEHYSAILHTRKKSITMNFDEDEDCEKIVFLEGQELHPNVRGIITFDILMMYLNLDSE
ncbi:hypothetical protein Syun_014639 [Stephania yunnanensis]|uniref:Uncharacterized protein n=1 Tax=Stephania yunnanensis TaxID=152371 RepID=A0AAP0P9T4_9MAGN